MIHLGAIQHLWASYCKHWKVSSQITLVDDNWQLKGSLRQMRMPCQPQNLIPTSLSFTSVNINEHSLTLPLPGNHSHLKLSENFGVDILHFLVGQLWRAEELLPEHLHAASHGDLLGLSKTYSLWKTPFVDLWMRAILEYLEGPLPQPTPQVWLTYDVDCLRKWKAGTILKQSLKHPWKMAKEILRTHFFQVQRDPWFTIPRMRQQLQGLPATFFWLGHFRDHLAQRYDIRHPLYAQQVQACQADGHTIGLHGSPLHAHDLSGLQNEKQIIDTSCHQSTVAHRQHYLRLTPSTTLQYLCQIGTRLDSTYGFNHNCGYRCGSCLPIAWWDFATHQALPLMEMPLIMGDWTLHDPQQFDAQKSWQILESHLNWTTLAGGILSLDFHELYFSDDYPGHAEFHAQMLQQLQALSVHFWQPQEFL